MFEDTQGGGLHEDLGLLLEHVHIRNFPMKKETKAKNVNSGLQQDILSYS